MASEQAHELRQRGIAAAKAGQKEQARQLLQQALRIEPRHEATWVWLMSVARDQRERLICLHRLLEINPQNSVGQQALQALGITREQLAQQATGKGEIKAMPPRRPEPPAPASPTPGVPIPDTQRLAEAQSQVDAIVRDYLAPLSGDKQVTWVHKTSKRAGERAATLLNIYVAGGVTAAIVLVLVIGFVIIWNTPELRGVVFAPTRTPTFTPAPPTLTPTPTIGVTPTSSPTPLLTYTPSPTIPADFPDGAATQFPQPTPLYPLPERGVRNAVAIWQSGGLETALPLLEIEVTQVSISFDPNPYYYRALALAESGDTDAALQLLSDGESRLQNTPNAGYQALLDTGIAQVNLGLAEAALGAGERDDARLYLNNVQDRAEAAIEGDPRLVQAYLALARFYSLQNDDERAVGVLNDALAVPQLAADVNLLVARGEADYRLAEYDQAIYQAYLALYVEPANEAAHLLRVRAALAENQPGLAVNYVEGYLIAYPGSVTGYTLRGDAFLMEGKTDLALENYNQALAGGTDDPAALGALVARGRIYMQTRRYADARDDFTQAFNLSDDPNIQALRMQAAYEAGSYATAERDADALLGQNVLPDADIQLLRARLIIDRAAAGDTEAYQEALDLLNENANRVSSSTQAVVNEYRARADYHLESYRDALRAIDAALAGGETGGRHYLRGLILEAQGETEAAIREYEWVAQWGQVYPYAFLPDTLSRLDSLLEAES
ncbi:MAG: tetratricopeptide repeat protein [Anaerolineaceae bacterium]|nr:tetratricopeptide repeat protein [Anaerolineaceae bacterium]